MSTADDEGVMGRVSRAAWIYIAAVVVAAASVVAPRLSGPPMGTGWWLSLGVLMLLFLICDSTPTPLAARQSAWSPSSSATLAAVVLLGPVGAALVGAVSVLGLRRKLQLAERVFNGGMYAVSGFAAGQTFVALGGHIGLPRPDDFPAIVWPFAARRRRARDRQPRPDVGCAAADQERGRRRGGSSWSPACRCCWRPTWVTPRSGW